jgi:hypothetical protein
MESDYGTFDPAAVQTSGDGVNQALTIRRG